MNKEIEESLLGQKDTEALRILTIRPEGASFPLLPSHTTALYKTIIMVNTDDKHTIAYQYCGHVISPLQTTSSDCTPDYTD